jgi:hypothetical protein
MTQGLVFGFWSLLFVLGYRFSDALKDERPKTKGQRAKSRMFSNG